MAGYRNYWRRDAGINPADRVPRVGGKALGERIVKALSDTSRCSDFEKSFLTSIQEQFKKRKNLSQKQVDLLVGIETKQQQTGPVVDPNAAVRARVEAVAAETRLSDWEKGFCSSLLSQLDRRALSQNQIGAFERIEIRFSPEAKEKLNAWVASFDAEKRRNWHLVTDYYRRGGEGYYKGSVANATDPEYVPDQTEYERVCSNKYAVRVIAAVTDPPRFEAGKWACVRSISGRIEREHRAFVGKLVLVIKNDNLKVVSAAKGAKLYTVLPIGSAETIEIEERYLKRAPKGV